MIAVYNNNEYRLISHSNYKEIVTRQPGKADASFTQNGVYYLKKVDEKELSDIFEVRLWVKYHTDFDNVSDWWAVSGADSLINRTAKLLFGDGFLPEWEEEEKNVCYKKVAISDLSDAAVAFIYSKKGGIIQDPPVRMEKQIPASDIETYHRKYCTNREI